MPAQIVGKKEQKNNSSIYKTLLIMILVTFGALLLTRVTFSNILAVSGQRLTAASQEVEVLKEENQKLENEISKLGSLSRIEKMANKAGLVKAENIEILTPSKPIANR